MSVYRHKNDVALWAASYSACVVYTETIIHLCVGESGGYLPRSYELKLGLENNHIQTVQVNVLFSASIDALVSAINQQQFLMQSAARITPQSLVSHSADGCDFCSFRIARTRKECDQ